MSPFSLISRNILAASGDFVIGWIMSFSLISPLFIRYVRSDAVQKSL